jgi:hypothetical protein
MKTIALTVVFVACLATSCNKLDQLDESPELQPLAQGFQATAAIGYCASLVVSAFNGETLPANVDFDPRDEDGYTGAGLITVHVTQANPLPFNDHIGDIFIAALWDGNSGVMSVVFADIDFLASNFEFYGLHTVPVFEEADGDIRTLFAEQDIIIGNGSDTLLNLSMSKPSFNLEQQRLNSSYPGDVFAAIAQKVWFMDIERNNPNNVYDDFYTVNGGGQVLEARSTSGGILYHAMIDTEYSFADCEINPTDGTAFIQNVKAGGSTIDLGNITFNFHSGCDGKADVIVATGKYVGSNGKSINLNFN